MTAAVGGRHTKAILGQLAGGAPTAGLAARRAWLAHTPRRQVLAGAGTGPPTGEKTLAIPTGCGGTEAERVNAEQGPSLKDPGMQVTSPPATPSTCFAFHLAPGLQGE